MEDHYAELPEAGPARRSPWHRWPEWFLVAAALVTFLSYLGRTQLWGRREERVAATVADTVRQGHWLVANMHNRPRLQKPPLARWCSAGAILLTGRMDEASLRLPCALAALATVAVVYFWGRQLGGRELGVAASLILTTTTLFVMEMRQASADSLLVLLVTSSLWCFWVAHHRGGSRRGLPPAVWLALSGVAAGLGVLAKGPVTLILLGIALGGYVLCEQGLAGWRRLLAWQWWVAMVAVALPWPVLVLLHHPEGWRVWWWEATIKLATGSYNRRLPLLLRWVEMTVPWTPLAVAGLMQPFRRRGQDTAPGPTPVDRGGLWLCWWWCVGNLLMFSCWKIAKPSYYLPCLPGAALLAGSAWQAMAAELRSRAVHTRVRIALGMQWTLFALGLVGVAGAGAWYEPAWRALLVGCAVVGLACVAVGWVLRRGIAALPLLATPHVLMVLLATGWLLPSWNQLYSHKAFAEFAELVASEFRGTALPIWYLRDPNESLWFYLDQPPRRGHRQDRLIRVVHRSKWPLLLVLARREYEQLSEDRSLALTVLEREGGQHRRPALVLVRAELPIR